MKISVGKVGKARKEREGEYQQQKEGGRANRDHPYSWPKSSCGSKKQDLKENDQILVELDVMEMVEGHENLQKQYLNKIFQGGQSMILKRQVLKKETICLLDKTDSTKKTLIHSSSLFFPNYISQLT